MFKRALITSLSLSVCWIGISADYVSAKPDQSLKVADLNLFFGGGNKNSSEILDTVLFQHGLQETKCRTGAVEIITSKRKSRCAIPTAQYPGGLYKLNDDYTLSRIGGPQIPPPSVQNPGPQIPSPPVQTPFPTVPSQNPFPTIPAQNPVTTVPVGGAQWPSIIDNAAPNSPVSPNVTLNIQNILGRRGVQLMPFCPTNFNAVPSALFIVNNRYTACAHPSLSFPAGRYRVDSQTIF